MNLSKLAGAAFWLSLAACASGPGPDLEGPQGPSLMSAYSGDWTLLRLESDDLAAKMRESMGGDARFFAASDWTRKGIEVRRKTDTGAEVKDLISLDQPGRLVVKRGVEVPRAASVKGTLVYRKE